MKTILEYGIPQSALKTNRPCGVSGKAIFGSIKDGILTAEQMQFVMSEGQSKSSFDVSKSCPRITWWASDRSFWITLSILDGTPRGDYASKADKDSALKVI